MAGRMTRTGPIREGIEYQDLFGVSLLIGWLERRETYAWVKLEADEFGSLDDVTACTFSRNLLLMQIKHSVSPDSPEDAISLEEILEIPPSKTGRRRSLFQKWFSSWRDARDSAQFVSIDAWLITNRRSAIPLLQLISSDPQTGALHIDADKIASTSPDKWSSFLDQAQSSPEDVRQFLGIFYFQFDSPAIEIQRTALQARARNLGITDDGYQSLEKSAKEWATKRDLPGPDGFIHLDDVKFAAQWAVPKGLNERFEIPSDFVPLGGSLVEQLIESFRSVKGGTKVVYGSPGSGKSTFLSHLFEKLRESGIMCVRHHYFIEPKDPDRLSRLTCERASEAVLHDLSRLIPEILPNVNPDRKGFGVILHSCAESLV